MAESEGDKVVDEKDPELDGEEDEEEDEEDKSPVPVRKSSTFFAQRRIIAKQKKQIEAFENEEGEQKGEEGDDIYNIQSLIRKELHPVVAGLKSQSDELELREHLAEHPEHKKFEKAARKRIEAWPNVPISDIFKTLTYGGTDKDKDNKKSEAENKAKKGNMGGSSARTEETDNIPRTEKEQKDAYNRVKKGETIKLG